MVETSLRVDKICIRYAYGQVAQTESEFMQLQQFKESVKDGSLGTKGKVWLANKAAITYMSLPLPSGASLLVKYGYVHGRFWSWIEFNPSRLSDEDQVHVSACMDLLFTHGMATLWSLARITRIDIAVDAKPASFEGHLFLDRRLKSAQHQYDGDGSTYLGSKEGEKTLLFYDKAKERWDKVKEMIEYPWLRLEARVLDPRRWAFHGISDIGNPFSTVLVVNREQLLAIDCKVLGPVQSRVAYGEPLDRVYWEMPAVLRAEIWNSLQSVRAAWWNPQSIWQKYGGALAWVDDLLGPGVQSIAKVEYGAAIGGT